MGPAEGSAWLVMSREGRPMSLSQDGRGGELGRSNQQEKARFLGALEVYLEVWETFGGF